MSREIYVRTLLVRSPPPSPDLYLRYVVLLHEAHAYSKASFRTQQQYVRASSIDMENDRRKRRTADDTEDDATIFREKLLLTALYYYGVAALGLASAVVGPTLFALGRACGIQSIGVLSYVFVLRAFFYFVGSTVSGYVVTRFRCGFRVLTFSLLWSAAFLSAIPFVSNATGLFVTFCLQGLGSGVLTNIPQTMTIELWGSDVGPYMQALHFSYGVGATASPLLVHGIMRSSSDSFHVLSVYWMIAAFHFVGAALMLASTGVKRRVDRVVGTTPDPLSLSLDGDEEGEKTSLLLRDSIVPASSSSSDVRSFVTVAAMTLFIFLYVGNEVASGGLLYAFARRSAFAFAPARAALLTTTYWAFFSLGRLGSIPVSIFVAPKTLLTSSLFVVMLSVAILRRSVEDAETSGSAGGDDDDGRTMLWTAVAALGLSNGPIYASAIVVLEEHVRVTGNVISALVAGDTLGEMIIPGVIGSVMSRSTTMFVWGVGGASLAATLIYFALYFAVLSKWQRRRYS